MAINPCCLTDKDVNFVNSVVDTDVMVHNEPSHLDLHCLPFFFVIFFFCQALLLEEWTCSNSDIKESIEIYGVMGLVWTYT